MRQVWFLLGLMLGMFFAAKLLAAEPVQQHHCRNAPYLKNIIRMCSSYINPPATILLDQAHYDLLKREVEQCIGHPLNAVQGIKLCHIPVTVEGQVPRGKELGT